MLYNISCFLFIKMKRNVRFLLLAVLIALSVYSCAEKNTFAKPDDLAGFFDKKEVTIAVTDSGLGGLSIVADAAEKMRKLKIFGRVKFIFFNALFSNQGGYNRLKTREEKIRIFDSALNSLEQKYSPDLILIGCNTLSVFYDETEFSQKTKIPVIGIIEAGAELIAQDLKAHPESKVILFATQTTVAENTHKSKLLAKGFLSERIIPQPCPDLIPYIETGYDSTETEMLIFAYVDEALQQVCSKASPILVSLNCTHYGYSLPLWEKAFENLNVKPLAILNPNSRMVDFLFRPRRHNRYMQSDISVRVVSMVEISQEQIASIGEYIKKQSPQTAEALENYDLEEKLFKWEKFLKQTYPQTGSQSEPQS